MIHTKRKESDFTASNDSLDSFKSLSVTDALSNNDTLAEQHIALGTAKMTDDKFDHAQAHFAKAVTLLQGRRPEILAEALFGVGMSLHMAGKNHAAIQFLNSADKIYSRIGGLQRRARVLVTKGEALRLLGKHSQAQKQFDIAIGISVNHKNREGLFTALCNKAYSIHMMGKYHQAMILFRICSDYYDGSDSFQGAVALAGLGHTLNSLGMYLEARKCLVKSYMIFRRFQEMFMAADSLIGLGYSFLRSSSESSNQYFIRAIRYYDRAISEECSSPFFSRVYKGLCGAILGNEEIIKQTTEDLAKLGPYPTLSLFLGFFAALLQNDVSLIERHLQKIGQSGLIYPWFLELSRGRILLGNP